MSLLSFLKDAGENFLNSVSQRKDGQGPNRKAEIELSIFNYIAKNHLSAKNLSVSFDEATHTVHVSGVAPDQNIREKIVLCCGNLQGVQAVDDQLEVERGEDLREQGTSQFYTVTKGDTLSKIAREFYGDANRYPIVFEANKPMLTSPDRIYPGQVLRIPALV